MRVSYSWKDVLPPASVLAQKAKRAAITTAENCFLTNI